MRWGAGCLVLRTRNGRLKELFVPGGTLPTHPDCSPSLWTSYMMGLVYGLHIDHTFTTITFYVRYLTKKMMPFWSLKFKIEIL